MADDKRDIFAIVGLPPEVLAVAMAKYSRSAKSIKETIDELTEEKSAEFHEKWVLGYGDASVADMAIVALALENVSILASKVIEDNRIAAYQEKSTRYQSFALEDKELSAHLLERKETGEAFARKRYFKPRAIMASGQAALFTQTADFLFEQYTEITKKMMEYYSRKYPKPADMTDKAYAAKVRARSLDVARYLLPAATLTNFGMIINARSLRHAISKMMGHQLEELHEIGAEMREAAINPAYNPQSKKIEQLLAQLRALGGKTQELADQVQQSISLQVKGAPTLIKHTDPKEYLTKTSTKLAAIASELLKDVVPEAGERASYLGVDETYEDELIITLLYGVSHCAYRQIADVVRRLQEAKKKEIIKIATAHRSQWDWPTRHFETGRQFTFDTLMDYGAFRDLQRHRLTTQINQELGVEHGYELPLGLGIDEAGLTAQMSQALERVKEVYLELKYSFPNEAQYIIPLGFRKRTLFKMNLRELTHIVELRTKAGGHLSYRDLCYEMYAKVSKRHPLLTMHIRAVKPDFPKEFFER